MRRARFAAIAAALLCLGCAPSRWIIEGCTASPDLDMNGVLIEREALRSVARSVTGYTTVLLNHDPMRPVGRLLFTDFRGGVLWVAVEISRSEPDVWAKIKDGTLTGLSLGFVPLDSESDYSDEQGREIKRVTKLTLVEVSVVAIPSNPRARLRIRVRERGR